MATTVDTLRAWFEEGRARGYKYMLVATDTFDHEDYPVFTDDPHARVAHLNRQEMTKVMEVYDLSREFQAEGRAWQLPTKGTT